MYLITVHEILAFMHDEGIISIQWQMKYSTYNRKSDRVDLF